MLRNHIRVAFRNLVKQGFYSLLNVLGLAIAFAALFIILGYLRHETSFERFHQQKDRIFRITYQYQTQTDFEVHWARVPVNFVNNLPEEIPEIEQLIRFQNQERKYVRVEQNKFRPEHAYLTDAAVFEVFDFELLEGDPGTALSQPYSVVLSQSIAESYFGTPHAMGKTLHISGDFDAEEKLYTVRGIMKDLPAHTHLPVDMFLSFTNPEERTGWAYVYTLLAKGAQPEAVKAKFPAFIDQYTDGNNTNSTQFDMQALGDIHLNSQLAREIVPGGSNFYVRVFFFTGLSLLLIALFNYINLNNAIALRRAKEISMRKILGASKKQLSTYGLVESLTYSFLAAGIGWGMGYLLFPFFRQLWEIDITLDLGWVSLGMVGIALLCGMLIGLYPAFFMTAYHPLQGLKENKSLSLSSKGSSFAWKRAMLTLQFSAAILLVSGTLIAGSQMKFLTNKNLGLDRSQVLSVRSVPSLARERYPTFKDRVLTLPGIEGVGACMEVPSRPIRDSGPVCIQGVNEDPNQAPTMDAQVISPDFISLMGMEILAGKESFSEKRMDFSPAFTDTYTPQTYLLEQPRTYVINETAMRKLGWQHPEEAIGQRINWSIGGFELAYGPITAVVKDYHQESLRHSIDPLIMFVEPIWLGTFLIKLNGRGISQAVNDIQGVWDELYPSYPFAYHFLDDLYHRLYVRERVQFRFLQYLSGLAIFLAFMGLFALIAYSLKTRRKEIAIRKILGAGARHIFNQMSKEYMWVFIIGTLVAIPISYYYLQVWLQTFAYQIAITGIPYLWSILFILLLLGGTLALQTFSSIRINPAEVLKDE